MYNIIPDFTRSPCPLHPASQRARVGSALRVNQNYFVGQVCPAEVSKSTRRRFVARRQLNLQLTHAAVPPERAPTGGISLPRPHPCDSAHNRRRKNANRRRNAIARRDALSRGVSSRDIYWPRRTMNRYRRPIRAPHKAGRRTMAPR